ncbi:receptor-transporting protein 5 isoform X1 [Odocoileus virginianus]|uniref:Receptor-transporting protein 5 isoform X1 n=1 Tax=Odocoileus virginianus TaxID=9874 RepID=A0A6J0Z5E8_ODOVR
MDGADVWAKTLAQLMAQTKPQDTWELVPQENLASGHLDSSGFQYRLRGLSRLQCGRCQWGWASAHVHVLFHLWWDEAGRRGLVKMRVWGQRCRWCPPGGAECRVSLLNVRLFLGKLVRFIAQKCYAEGPGSDQGPEICFGERCEACDLGVCFFQQPPDPAWGPEGRSTGSIKGRFTLYSSGDEAAPAAGRQLRTLGRGLLVDRPGGCTPNAIAVPLYAADFIRSPIAEGRDFCGQAEEVITIPFSLGRRAWGLAGEPAGVRHIIGRGSLYLPASSKATSKGRRFPVNIKAPVFHGKGLLLSGAKATTGFIYKGLGCVSEPDEGEDGYEDEDEDTDWGARSSSTRLVPVGASPRPMTYIVGLMDNGEGSVTFPSSLTDVLLEDADPFDLVHGSLTFPFMFAYEGRAVASSASGPEGRGQVAGGCSPPAAGRERLLGTDAGSWVPLGEGSITVPFSVFSVIQSKSSGSKARGPQGDGLVPWGSSKKPKQPGPWAARFRLPPLGDEGFCWAEGFCFDPYEEVWIWVSLAVCVLWIMYLCKFSPDRSPWV